MLGSHPARRMGLAVRASPWPRSSPTDALASAFVGATHAHGRRSLRCASLHHDARAKAGHAAEVSTSATPNHAHSGEASWAVRRSQGANGLTTGDGQRSKAKERIAAIDAIRPHATSTKSPFLRDRHHRQHTYLRISLTERCNLRCIYCMPEEGVTLTPKPELLTSEEVQRLARLFVLNGVEKIRLTGGEPTVRRDLEEIIGSLNTLRPHGLKSIGMTSNGLALARRLPALASAGLSHLNISLDTFDPFKFELMTRRPAGSLDAVLKTLQVAQDLRLESVKINVVLLRGVNDSEEELRNFVEYTRHRDVVVRFIEYMPFDGNKWQTSKLIPYDELLTKLRQMYGELERLKDDQNDTTKAWRIPGCKGSIGFITSMTDHFCGTCNRLRITADGNLKVCLFGNSEVSLRDAMRGEDSTRKDATDEELIKVIGAAVGRKHAKHAGPKCLRVVPASSSVSKYKGFYSTARIFKSDTRLRTLSPRLPTSTRSARFFSSTTRMQDDENPWESLDQSLENMRRAPTRTVTRTRAKTSSSPPFSQPAPSSRPQTWSEYMGGQKDDDDNPWANLDAFADSSSVVPGSERLSYTGVEGSEQDGFAANNENPPSMGRKHSVDPERAMMEAAVARMLARQDGQSSVSHSHQIDTRAEAQVSYSRTPKPKGLTHIDAASGHASMVDVGDKASTKRIAVARGRVWLPRKAIQAVQASEGLSTAQGQALSKGPVLHTAQLAGIMGAKRTSDLIPLCHSLALSKVDVRISWDDDEVLEPEGGYLVVECTAITTSQTGVEMEALTGVSVACLTIWDMVKAVAGKEMVIEDLKVVRKSGGKSGDWVREY